MKIRQWGPVWGRLFALVVLLYTVPTLILLLLRWAVGEALSVVALYNNLLPLALFPAPLLLALAVSFRKWGMVRWTLPVVAVFVLWYGPYFTWRQNVINEDERLLTVLTYNARTEISDLQQTVALLQEQQPHLVAMQEFRTDELAALLDQTADQFPYHAHAGDQLILSQYEITSEAPALARQPGSETLLDVLRITVDADGVPLAFYNFHPLPPVGVGLPEGTSFGASLRETGYDNLLAMLAEDPVQTVIVAGDFNATDKTRDFQRVLAAGYTDVFGEVGYGLGLTFPNVRALDFNRALTQRAGFGLGLLPPMLRIDFVLHNGQRVRALSAEPVYTGTSDHHPLVAKMAVPLPR